jgi:hypothetical protein
LGATRDPSDSSGKHYIFSQFRLDSGPFLFQLSPKHNKNIGQSLALMKCTRAHQNIFVLVALFALTLASPTYGGLIVYEGFDYPAGDNIVGKSGGTGWAGPWDDGTGEGQYAASSAGHLSPVVASGLTYTDAAGNVLVVTGNKLLNSGTNRVDNTTFTSRPARTLPYLLCTNGTTTWLSFLGQRVGSPNASGTFQRGANLSTFNTEIWSVNTSGQLSIGENSGNPPAGVTNDTWSFAPLGSNARRRASTNIFFTNLVLVVIRIDHFDDGTNAPAATPDLGDCDNVFFWLNPPLGVEPSTNNAVTNILSTDISGPLTQGFDFAFNRIVLFAGAANSTDPAAEWYVDELRVGDTYADVTPFIPFISPLPPQWTGISHLPAGGILLTLTGAANGQYAIDYTTNLTTTSWQTLSKLSLDGSGQGTFTDNDPVAGDSQRYYRARKEP